MTPVHQRRNNPDEEPPSVEEVQAIFRRAREREPEPTEALVERVRETLDALGKRWGPLNEARYVTTARDALAELTERLAAAERALQRRTEELAVANELDEKHEAQVNELAARVKVLEEALEVVGAYAFGTWELEQERLEAGRKGEELARAALSQVRTYYVHSGRHPNFVDSETGRPVAVNPDTGKWEIVEP